MVACDRAAISLKAAENSLTRMLIPIVRLPALVVKASISLRSTWAIRQHALAFNSAVSAEL
jgi:hypothetical protein